MDTTNTTNGLVTQEELKQMFLYNTSTGELIYQGRPKGRLTNGCPAGTRQQNGYRHIMIKGKRYYTHRLVWLYHHGYHPKLIDHINQNKEDNRIENLREVEHLENAWNVPTNRTTSKTGFRGVCHLKVKNKYLAYMYNNKQFVYIGEYDTAVEAAIAYNDRVLELRGEYAAFNDIPSWLLPQQ